MTVLPPIPSHDDFYKEVEDLIFMNFRDSSFDVNKLSRQLKIDRRRLHASLTKAGKLSAIQQILRLRITYGEKLLLETELTVAEIAYKCGFNDPNYFSRMFFRKQGCCPTHYRMQNNNSVQMELEDKYASSEDKCEEKLWMYTLFL